jgi:phytoene desaturase
MMRTIGGRTDHVVVVGAGLAGLSAALHLAGRGRAVTVVERGDVPADASADSTSTDTGSTPARPFSRCPT